MDEATKVFLMREELAFFGKISASLSHELKNVIATINEFSGLLGDLTTVTNTARPLNLEKLQTICTKISKQVARGEGLIQRMNRFSHSVDEPFMQSNICELLNNLLALTERFATLKQVALEKKFPDKIIHITLDPFLLQLAVFLCVDIALNAAKEKRYVVVSLETAPSVCKIYVQSSDPMNQENLKKHQAKLEMIAKELKGTLSLEKLDGKDSIALSLAL